MSKLWDDLKDNMKDWSVSAVEKAEEMSKIAVAKTEEMTRISKVKFEIHQIYRELDKVYADLGKLAYKHTKNDHMATFSGNKYFFDLVNKIEDLKLRVNAKESQIVAIKKDFDIDQDHNDENKNNTENNLSEISKNTTDAESSSDN